MPRKPRLKASRIGKSELYEVSFTAKYPESAARVVQAIVDTYMRFQTSESDAQRQRVLELLTEEQAVRDHDIDLIVWACREVGPATHQKATWLAAEVRRLRALVEPD